MSCYCNVPQSRIFTTTDKPSCVILFTISSPHNFSPTDPVWSTIVITLLLELLGNRIFVICDGNILKQWKFLNEKLAKWWEVLYFQLHLRSIGSFHRHWQFWRTFAWPLFSINRNIVKCYILFEFIKKV